MLGRSFLNSADWEFFPFTENSTIKGILVDANISISGASEVYITQIDFASGVITVQLEINSIGYSTAGATQTVYGDYTILNYSLPDASLAVTLIFLSSQVSIDNTFVFSPKLRFNQIVVSVVPKAVTTLNTNLGAVEIVFEKGFSAEVIDGIITLSIDNESIVCPETCPDVYVKTVNNSLLNSQDVIVAGDGYRVVPGTNTLTVVNHLQACCDCEDQALVWNTYVNQAILYNTVVDALTNTKSLYDDIRVQLDNVIVTCPFKDKFALIKELYFPDNLFCEVAP